MSTKIRSKSPPKKKRKSNRKKKVENPLQLIFQLLSLKSIALLEQFTSKYDINLVYDVDNEDSIQKKLISTYSNSTHGMQWQRVRIIDIFIIENFWPGIVWLISEKQCPTDIPIGRVAKWWHRKVEHVNAFGEIVNHKERAYFYDYSEITSRQLAENFGIILPSKAYRFSTYMKEREQEMNKVLPPLTEKGNASMSTEG